MAAHRPPVPAAYPARTRKIGIAATTKILLTAVVLLALATLFENGLTLLRTNLVDQYDGGGGDDAETTTHYDEVEEEGSEGSTLANAKEMSRSLLAQFPPSVLATSCPHRRQVEVEVSTGGSTSRPRFPIHHSPGDLAYYLHQPHSGGGRC